VLVGHGEVAWAGAAVIGAGVGAIAAAGCGREAGFLAAGFLGAGFFVAAGAGVSSTTTGLGRNLGGSPVAVIASSFSVSGW